jgi:carboxylesterase
MIYRYQRTLTGRLFFWSSLSVLVGVWGWLRGGLFEQGLALQFIIWGLIDVLIALYGQKGLKAKINGLPNLNRVETDMRNLSRLLWINTGLDVLYICGGLSLALALGFANPFWMGSGIGILIQGCFLFVFDLLHARSLPSEVFLPHTDLFDAPQHQPFDLPGSHGIAILVHGFPGTPVEMLALGRALNLSGWRAVGLLLPGFGNQLPGLFQQRAAAWVGAIARQIDSLRDQGVPVVLIGFSLGGGLSIPAAVRSRPDALVLISPFWLDIHPPLAFLVRLIGLFLPETVAPLRSLSPAQFGRLPGLEQPPGDLYPPVETYFNVLKNSSIPLLFGEQFLELDRLIRENAPRIDCPTLVVQGNGDRVVRPNLTRRLINRLGSHPKLIEINDGHHLVFPSTSGFPEMAKEVLKFLSRYLV